MKSSRVLLAAVAAIAISTTASPAARIDMNDPRRALGREDDVRVDAQLVRDTVSPGSPIGVTYQIQNFTDEPVAIAHRVSDASYDLDSRTITLSIGAEVPVDGNMPEMITIAPGEKKVLTAAAIPSLGAQAIRPAARATPRFVQVKVTILRGLQAFKSLLERQAQTSAPQELPDELFDRWFENSNSIFLNALPVHFSPGRPVGVEHRAAPRRGI